MSLKDISRPQISASNIGKTSYRTEPGGRVIYTLVKPTSPISKMRQHNRVTTGDTTREIIPVLTVKNSFIPKGGCSNTGDLNACLLFPCLHWLTMESNDADHNFGDFP